MTQEITQPQATYALVGRHELAGATLIKGLERLGGLGCIGQFSSIEEALHSVAETLPDVLLLDQRLQASDVPSCRTVRALSPSTRIIVLVHYLLPRDHLLALLSGASGCLVKDSYSLRQIKDAMLDATQNGSIMKSSLVADLAHSLQHNWPYQFTSDEKRLIERLVEFRTDTEISEETGVSQEELWDQVIQIHRKLTLTYRL
jgi:DNA-binding NarL/FixJ family response regulator